MRGNNPVGRRAIVVLLLIFLAAAFPLIAGYFYSNGFSDLTGKATSSVYIANVVQSTCVLNLSSGWHLISIYCEATNMSISNILGVNDTNYTSIHAYDPTNEDDNWKAYSPNLPDWVIQDLDTISVDKGYWINLNENETIIFNGSLKYPRLVSLKDGWNLIGYPSNITKAVNESFLDILVNLDSVHMYNSSDNLDPWKAYSTGVDPSQNDLIYASPNYGYWLKMNDNDTWMVDE